MGAHKVSGRTGRPRSRVQRLRRWLLASAVVFTGLLIVLIGYTRYRVRHALTNLPHQLGIDIKSEANSFTISRSGKDGRPLFTVHASKAIQRTNGKTTLHDVAVTIYGPPGSNRTDSIRGAEFEYDQANGVVRAMGETVLDVGVADGSNAPAHAKRLTMQAKGLVFLQKLGVASTSERIRFQYGASQGEAVGADYEMDTGVLTLQHDVHLHSMENGHLERIDAASAQLDRNTRIATLQNATLTDANDSMQAPHMVATLRSAPDEHSGTLQRVDASGGVTLRTAAGQRVQAPELHADITPANKLQQVTMLGGVHLQDDQTDASALRALVRFQNGAADHLTLTGQAHLQQTPDHGTVRTLDAAQIDSSLRQVAGAHLVPGELHATGSARLLLQQPAKQAGRTERTELTSPDLVAHTAPSDRTAQLHDLLASGGAHLLQEDGAGNVRTSTSDTLTAEFANTPNTFTAALQSVVQQGNVRILETRPAAAAQPGIAARSPSQTEATADHADFRANTDLLVLTGSPRVSGDGLQLSAARITLHRNSGDAEATGAVRGSIAQANAALSTASTHSPQTTQFAGDSIRLSRGSGSVLLKGGSTDARLWSSTGQVEASVIEADQRANTLHAFGEQPGTGGAIVKTVLTQEHGGGLGATSGTPGAEHRPLRVFSRDLFYRGGTAGKPGTAEFRGNVRMLDGTDVIMADDATALLRSTKAQRPALTTAQTVAMFAGGLETITADGHVRIQAGDRAGTGSHLVYTAATRTAVLTGTPGAPPVLREPMQGTLSGTEVTLRLGQGKGDNQMEVSGAPNTPVHTELDVPDSKSGPAPQARSQAGRKSRPKP